MNHTASRLHGAIRRRLSVGAVSLLLAAASLTAAAQHVSAPLRKTSKAVAPIDLTGYWVAVVTQDWRQRMVTPARGDYASIPITAEAKKVGDIWDPAKDEATGEQCRSYGAPAIMRVPGRVHITWQSEETLKLETDAGMQTRLFHFGRLNVPSGPPTWQGESIAQWETSPVGRGDAEPKSGSLKVMTTHLRLGYLRKNGVPYSANAVLTEYWDLLEESNGEQWIEITSVVEDSLYLRQPWVTALHFRKEPNGAKWDPAPCSSTW